MRSIKSSENIRSKLVVLEGPRCVWAHFQGAVLRKWYLFSICFFGHCCSVFSVTNAMDSLSDNLFFSNSRELESESPHEEKIQLAQKITSSSLSSSLSLSKVTAIEIVGDTEKTIIQITLTRAVRPDIYTLESPYRVFIDFPMVEFSLMSKPVIGRGLIKTYRYGEIGVEKARLVLDTIGPISITKTTATETGNADEIVILIEIKSFNSESSNQNNNIEAFQSTKLKSQLVTQKNENRTLNTNIRQPVIVIDPGHGGADPGAIGNGNLLEKNIVLSVAQKLEDQLSRKGHYKIILTRDGDNFVSLNDRIKISQSHTADLFISLHADSFDQALLAQSIKGATIYTLSEEASDEEAREMAEKENASDLVAGIKISEQSDDAELKNILIDLIMRETSNFSAAFSHSLVTTMRPIITLSRSPERSAKFKVLRQTHTPAVLLELGYISNPKEADIMKSEEWQTKLCKSIEVAIDIFFKKRNLGDSEN